MGLVVTGIADNGNSSAIEAALRSAGLSLEPLSLFVEGEAPEGHPDTNVRFVYGGTDSIRDLLGRGSSGIASTGSGVLPGLEIAAPESYFREETLADELSELEIPDSELENYIDAIEAGHAVVSYFARPENVAQVQDALSAAGVRNVRTF